mgnify:CR=1 FL=1
MGRILLKNCLIFINEFKDKTVKDIYIEDGKISAIEDSINIADKAIKIIDIREKVVFPGMIDCHTHMGIIEEGTGKIGVDNNETSNPVTPHLRGIDAINPLDISFGDAVSSGITCVMSGPGSNNAVGGHSIALKTFGTIIDKMAIKNPVGFKIALGENPLSTYGKDSKCPVTRMAVAGLIRELFMKAQDYMWQKEQGNIKERDIKLEAVLPLLKGEIPMRVHAHRADDIVTAIRIAEEFNISKLVIEHGTEAHLVKDYLREKNVPVAFGPMLTPRIKMEMRRRHYGSALELAEAGVKTALITDHPYNSIEQLRTVAALAVAEGLSTSYAMTCITAHPAEILGCEKRIGKLEVGYDADIAVFDGSPIDINAKCMMTIIDGNIVFERK